MQRLAGIAEQGLDFRRTEIACIDPDDRASALGIDTALLDPRARPFQTHPEQLRGPLSEFAHRVLLAGRDHEVLGLRLLQHEPLRAHEVTRMTPIAQRIKIAQEQTLFESLADARKSARYLARDEGLAANRGLVIEQNPVTGVHPIGFAIVDRDPVGIDLRRAIRRARIERSGFALRYFLHLAEHLGGRGLIETRALGQSENADRLEYAQRPERIGIRRVFRGLKRHSDMTLCGEVVDLIRLHLLDDADQIGCIGQITVMQVQAHTARMRVLVQMIDAVGIER